MRIFKTKVFSRFSRQERIDDYDLVEAIKRANLGSIDANLGSCLIKQRVARKGRGRSKGYRTLIAFKNHKMAVFIYGFPKSDKDNIDDSELESLKGLAKQVLKRSDEEIKRDILEGRLQEVNYD